MIRYSFNIEDKWKVIVYYNIDYDFFDIIEQDLYSIGLKDNTINKLYYKLYNNKAKAFTVSSISKHISIVGFNTHNNIYDYINSIGHEAEHIKQDMLKAYNVEDKEEPPAYTIGYLISKLLNG